MASTTNHEDQVKIASGLGFLAGLWVLVAPWVYTRTAMETTAGGSVWNNVVVGCIIAIFAAVRFFAPNRNVGLSWVNCALGAWLFISPWVFGFTENRARFYNSLIFGVVVAVLAAWSAVETRSTGLAGPRLARQT